MSLKAKLVSTIAAICMVICLLSVGIWAASTGTVNVGGTVSFTASDVDVTITATVNGAKTTGQTKTVTWSAANTEETLTADWSNLTLDFVKGSDIEIVLEITNNSVERSVGVAISDNESSATNYTHAVDLASDTLEAKGATGEGVSNTGTYKITLKVTDWNKLVSGTLAYKVVVNNVA